MELHESVRHTRIESVIKTNENFRVRMVKHEVLSPRGLFSIDLINETLDDSGVVIDSNSYNYFMTKEELQRLAHALQL